MARNTSKKTTEIEEQDVVEETTEIEEQGKEVTENAEENTAEDNTKETNKKLVANTSFIDKYTGEKYTEKTEFIVVKDDIETTKLKDNQYKISEKRAQEIKAKGYIA